MILDVKSLLQEAAGLRASPQLAVSTEDVFLLLLWERSRKCILYEAIYMCVCVYLYIMHIIYQMCERRRAVHTECMRD